VITRLTELLGIEHPVMCAGMGGGSYHQVVATVWRAARFACLGASTMSGGEIVDEIGTGTGVFACMLGGADGRTLFLCAAPDFQEHARAVAREAELRAVRVDVPHGGRP